METYYFTFTHKQETVDGLPMHGRWVRVIAKSFPDARRHFVLHFSSLRMPTPMSFAMQYDETRFQPKYYPDGELMCIKQEEE
jgi:hypothetical protein